MSRQCLQIAQVASQSADWEATLITTTKEKTRNHEQSKKNIVKQKEQKQTSVFDPQIYPS
jgi:hypothetical protein